MCRPYFAIVLLLFAKAAGAIPVPKGLDHLRPTVGLPDTLG